jgi:hypothetical protein
MPDCIVGLAVIITRHTPSESLQMGPAAESGNLISPYIRRLKKYT